MILKHCPFCGPGQSQVTVYDDFYRDGSRYWAVGCGRCGSHSGTRPVTDPEGRERVLAVWNSRPAEATEASAEIDSRIAGAKRRALALLDRWNGVAGVVSKDCGTYYELQSLIEDAVECGSQAARSLYSPLDGEDVTPPE